MESVLFHVLKPVANSTLTEARLNGINVVAGR